MIKKEIFIALMAGMVGGVLSSQCFRAGTAFASEVPLQTRILSAEKLVLVDKNGKARLGCGVSDDGRMTLAISDKDGNVRIGFGVLPDGSPSLDFYDTNNKARMVLGLKDDSPFLVFNDNNEIHRILVRQSSKGVSHIDFNDERGKLRAAFGDAQIGSKIESSLVFFNPAGDLLWKAPN